MEPRPSVVVLAGPNGAGKSTLSSFLLSPLGVTEFVNADVIAAEQAPLDPQSVSISAGREMLTRLRRLADNSVGRIPRLIAQGEGRTTIAVIDRQTWSRIQRGIHGRS